MNTGFTSRQKRIVFSCLMTYTTLYFCRLNLSAALEGIRSGLSLTIPQAGLLQTVFALTYACGQFVNGTVVDRVKFVRASFLQCVNESTSHWQQRPIIPNQLVDKYGEDQ